MADVTVETIVDENAAVAKVTVSFADVTGEYTGSSKRHPKDPAVSTIGEMLAISRAFQKAADDLNLWAAAEVKDMEYWESVVAIPFFKEPEPNAVSR